MSLSVCVCLSVVNLSNYEHSKHLKQDVSWVLHGCLVSHGRFRVSQGYSCGALRVFQEYSKVVFSRFCGYFKGVSRVFQGSFKNVSRKI